MAEILGNVSMNNIEFLEVDGDPSIGAGTQSAIGNIAIVNQPGFPLFQKFDVGDNDWRPIAVRSFAKFTNTEVNQNINAGSAVTLPTQVQILGNQENLDSDFSQIGENIQCNFDGFIRVLVNLHLFSTATRTSVNIRLRNNTDLVGPQGAGGYIRDTSGHNRSSVHIMTVLPISDGDQIGLFSGQEAGGGSTFLDVVGTSDITMERI